MSIGVSLIMLTSLSSTMKDAKYKNSNTSANEMKYLSLIAFEKL